MSTRLSTVKTPPAEAVRTGLAASALQRAVRDNLLSFQGRFAPIATPHDWYMALAYSVRDRMLSRMESTVRAYGRRDVKVACYLSAEFLIGPQLGNNLVNLGIEANAREAMAVLDQDLDALLSCGSQDCCS
jgi:glycogen phosphorylase